MSLIVTLNVIEALVIMGPLLKKVITIALIGYVIWMIIVGRTLILSHRDHPNVFLLNTRWVFRGEETVLYWVTVVFHIALVSTMTYMAFFQ